MRSHGKTNQGPGKHAVQFYEADAALVDAVAEYVGAALRAGDTGVVLATRSHRDALDGRLGEQGLDPEAARASGRFISLDAEETLAQLMTGDLPDPERFSRVMGGLMNDALRTGRRVRAFGEMVALLAGEGNSRGAIRLEQLWNGLQNASPFLLLCAYPLARLRGEQFAPLVSSVCAEHTQVIPAESYTNLARPEEQLQAIAVLQQRAQSLETEVVRRQHAEERLELALAAERAARQASEDALRLRDEFLVVASHELKTPLASLLAYAQLALRRLGRMDQAETRQEYPGQSQLTTVLQGVGAQGDKLVRLVDQLLDTSRLEAGRMVLECSPVDVVDLVKQVMASPAWEDGPSITARLPGSLTAVVDPLRVEQVLTNLLQNAVKYGPGSDTIELDLDQPAPGVLELSVRDHGSGISPEKRGQIFERFYQAHGDSHRSGLGLGLCISREIARLHGGELRAEFPDDGGSRFVLRLPTRTVQAEAASPAPANVARPVAVPSSMPA